MKGFKPTGYGPSAGFKFPTRMGFTGSTGRMTNVQPYVRRKHFANGGFVREDNPRMKEESIGDQGHATVRRGRAYAQWQDDVGAHSSLLPGYKDGGHWIKGAIKKPGALHQALGVPKGKKIPPKKLAKAAHSDNPTMRRRANLAKTLKKMHKADGGYVDRSYEVPRRYTQYTMKEGIKALPALAAEAVRSGVSSVRRKMSGLERKVGGRDQTVDEYTASASKYQHGGLAQLIGRAAPSRMAMQPPMTNRMMGRAAPPRMVRSKGGKAKRMGYAEGGSIAEKQSNYDPFIDFYYKALSGGRYKTVRSATEALKKAEQATKAKIPGHGAIKERFYAKGGGVSASQAKQIAQRTVGEHVRYPAPKGHKGLEKAMR